MEQVAIEDRLHDYVAQLQQVLGEDLTGVYLYGSLACGHYRPGRSDVDVVVVVARPVDDACRGDVLSRHRSLALPVDATFLTAAQLATDLVPTPVEFVIRPVGGGRLFRVRDGLADFLLARQEVHDHGVRLLGPQVPDLFRPVPTAQWQESLRQLLAIVPARVQGQGGHARAVAEGLVTLTRILHSWITGRSAGKTEAVKWAAKLLGPPWQPTLAAAARALEADDGQALTLEDFDRFYAYCTAAILR